MTKRLARLTAILLIALALGGCGPSLQERGVTQERLDTATPPLGDERVVGQTFVARQANLNRVEVLLVRYRPEIARAPGSSGLIFHLRAALSDKTDLATVELDAGGYEHNAPLAFSFAPLPDSRGREYYFCLEGVSGDDLGVWYSGVNAYGQGEMYSSGEAQGGDLRFVTGYSYDLSSVLGDVGRITTRYTGTVLLALVLILVPGWFLRTLLGLPRDPDHFAELSRMVSLSLAFMPLILLWTSAVGIRIGRWPVIAGLLLMAAVAAWITTRRSGVSPRGWVRKGNRTAWALASGLFAMLLCVRFLQIRDVALPLWVDSVHHTTIVRLIADHGMIPSTYEPYMPVRSAIYHYGYHADTAFYQWLAGLSSEEAVLVFGQVLNALCAASAYLLAARMVRSRLAGLFAFIAVGFVSVMPAYYVSWGRYTQLAGLVILPAFMVTLADALEPRKGRWSLAVAAAVLMGGLLVTHYRVAIVAACFALVWIGGALWRARRSGPGARQVGKLLVFLFACVMLLIAPWAWGFVRAFVHPSGALLSRLDGGAEARAMPWELLKAGHDRLLGALAVAGAVIGLLRRKRAIVGALLWVAVVALVVNLHLLGVPSTWVITNASVAIALFLPMSLFIGYLAFEIGRVARVLLARALCRGGSVLRRVSWRSVGAATMQILSGDVGLAGSRRALYRGIVVAAAVALTLWGGWGMLDTVNPVTVLATTEDAQAMSWIRENVPHDALFLINTRRWQYDMHMGTDGGWWIPVLTGRHTTLPPVTYTLGDPSYREQVILTAEMVANATSLDEPSVQERLEHLGISHVYVGTKAGHLTPQMLLSSEQYRTVYSSGEVWIFERRP